MENLKLKMIDFTGKSKDVVSERDMIFSFNNGEIKIYLSYVTGELKKIEIVSENEKIEKEIELEAVLKFKWNSVILDYEYGLYEHVEIEIEDKLEKYWADGKTVYLKEGKRIFLEIEIWEGYLLFFDDEYRMAGFGTECKNRKE
ncbi:hypothetical protein JMUB4039_0957 [Leptotrichia trevisanii]|uniref:hypothetical protein n=1 Tax=Leptotrichia trevisanii TaxID=109328 RepID=UPI0011887E95|nr:hypothetical protein [Leptotrichia trevisanii]BBM56979.1 hypothetical protein JMUB4039_0957 [Leptotrichia trevisanii]